MKIGVIQTQAGHVIPTCPVMRINDMPDGIVRWEGGQSVMVVVHCIGCVIGFFPAVAVLVAHFRQNNSANILLNLCLCTADLYLLTSMAIFDFINIAGGGWATGKIGCVINGFILCTCCFCSILTLLTATVERYLQVVHSSAMSKPRAWLAVISLWMLSFILGGLPFIINTFGITYALQSSNLLCVFSWWDRSLAQILINVTAFCTIISCLSAMIFCYASIFMTFRKAARSVGVKSFISQSMMSSANTKKSLVNSVQSNTEKDSALMAKEVRLLIKAVVLTLSFVIGWTPYMIKIIVEIAMEKQAPSEWEFLCQMCVLTNSIMNSLLMILLDARVKQNVLSLFDRNKVYE
jgi:hypothetical protein